MPIDFQTRRQVRWGPDQRPPPTEPFTGREMGTTSTRQKSALLIESIARIAHSELAPVAGQAPPQQEESSQEQNKEASASPSEVQIDTERKEDFILTFYAMVCTTVLFLLATMKGFRDRTASAMLGIPPEQLKGMLEEARSVQAGCAEESSLPSGKLGTTFDQRQRADTARSAPESEAFPAPGDTTECVET